MNQDELKTLVGQAALQHIKPDTVIGIGTGSTVNKLIDALAAAPKGLVRGAVSSSEASTRRLLEAGIAVLEAGDAGWLDVYIDGADEIDPHGHMVKGGGAALTREKIVAAQSRRFICIADASKRVPVLGHFPLPVEVIPMAAAQIARQFASGGVDGAEPGTTVQASLRMQNGQPLVTDNGQHILDVRGLRITNPLAFEREVNQWPGVITVGVFARHKAHLCLLGTENGVQTLEFA